MLVLIFYNLYLYNAKLWNKKNKHTNNHGIFRALTAEFFLGVAHDVIKI